MFFLRQCHTCVYRTRGPKVKDEEVYRTKQSKQANKSQRSKGSWADKQQVKQWKQAGAGIGA